jgi:hypothetical protein
MCQIYVGERTLSNTIRVNTVKRPNPLKSRTTTCASWAGKHVDYEYSALHCNVETWKPVRQKRE